MGREYHVSQKNGYDWQDGSAEKPFVTISKAAKIAMREIQLQFTKVFTENG